MERADGRQCRGDGDGSRRWLSVCAAGLWMVVSTAGAFAESAELGARLFGQAALGAAALCPIASPGFEEGGTWRPAGEEGHYLWVDPGAGRGGTPGAVIRVPSGATVSWPNFGQTLSAPAPGTLIHLRAWVRTEGVTDGYGAYLGIDYVGRNGERITWSQSGSLRSDSGWTRLEMYGEVPEATAAITLRLLLHGRGTAWFDDVFCETFPPIDAEPAPSVRLRVTDEVMHDGLLGFGVQHNPFARMPGSRLTERDWAVVVERLNALRPRWVRVFTDTRWWSPVAGGPYRFDTPAVTALLETLRVYDDMGARINLVMWRPTDWYPGAAERLTHAMAALIEWLRAQGIDRIAALTFYNEPDQEFRGSVAEYTALYRQMAATLAARGLSDVALVGADATQHGDRFFDAVATSLGSSIGMLGYHEYLDYRGSLRMPILHAARQLQRAEAAGTPPVYIWEFNLTGGTGAGTYSPGRDEAGQLLPERYSTALKLAAFALQALDAGVRGLSYWEAFDMVYPGGQVMSFGLWGSAAERLPIRPVYYAYGLLSRLVEPRAAIRRVATEPGGALITLAVVNPDGRLVLYLLNPWGEPVDVEARLPMAAAEIDQYTLSRSTVQAALQRQALQLPGERVYTVGSQLSVRVPAESMVALVATPAQGAPGG